MNLPSYELLFQKLLSSLTLLCKGADEQISYLEELGVGPSADELALEFDDCMGVVSELFEKGFVSIEFVQAVEELDQKLDLMSINADDVLWSFESLRNRKEWEDVRKIAKISLKNLRK